MAARNLQLSDHRKSITTMPHTDRLQTDCSKCAALCCVVLAFDKGEDFAFDKNPGEPCRNLSGHRCNIHEKLTQEGLKGCVAYDCLGAGNRVIQDVFGGQTWRTEPRLMRVMMEAFHGMCEVHKRIDLLRAAGTLPLKPQDEQIRCNFLDRLEDDHWSGPDLHDFEVGLALEIDIFMHGVQREFPTFLPESP
ncbi:hypothetical protein PXK30_11905 [Phaeobacter gallaeciensis]|uniref:hypothetical protein n=2 Tax=Phaeobacter gallaeciensis TaxID=60890 RepID=UPI00237F3B78|nr:hypothetical protein [Phaeobacter gallaeciensis]MDE4209402.1 hypothetical protein [Phaeobacter gallaeciensis]MDE4221987.1 hypothetical protein [Phaeobacter gallaeciensis]MDE4226066.1 hypothetical protein [Phaeobacter gallaeciensis]MDE4238767.1 hypothetical protein [Phaeobacter gallaeciensis]MDE4242768.1 hypothetical protein [Phaeobacter gallaeciensis]